MGVTCHLPRCRTRHPEGGVAPTTAAPSGTASPVLRPWCNRNAASDMRNRRRAHRNGVLVSTHPRCLMGTRRSAPILGGWRSRPTAQRRDWAKAVSLQPAFVLDHPDCVRSKTGAGRPARLRHEPKRDHKLHLGARLVSCQQESRGVYLRWKGMESTEEGDVLVRTAPIPLSCWCRAHASISEPASERPLARRRSARRARMVGDEAQS